MSTVDLAALLGDLDVREAGVRELVLDVVADRQVLEQVVGELALVEPGRLPVVDVADAEALGVDLLSHWSASSRSSSGVSATLMWQVLFSMRVARPRARARQRFSVGPSSTWISVIRMSSATRSWLFSAFAAAESISFAMSRAAPRGENAQQRPRLGHRHAADLVGDQARLARGDAHVAGASRARSAPAARSSSVAVAISSSARSRRRSGRGRSASGANSPSLWPTIDSETNTGTCLRPSWTAIVCPTISGKTVEVRDQVLTICLSPDSFICVDAPHQALLDERALLGRASHQRLPPFACRAGGRGRSCASDALPFLRVR